MFVSVLFALHSIHSYVSLIISLWRCAPSLSLLELKFCVLKLLATSGFIHSLFFDHPGWFNLQSRVWWEAWLKFKSSSVDAWLLPVHTWSLANDPSEYRSIDIWRDMVWQKTVKIGNALWAVFRLSSTPLRRLSHYIKNQDSGRRQRFVHLQLFSWSPQFESAFMTHACPIELVAGGLSVAIARKQAQETCFIHFWLVLDDSISLMTSVSSPPRARSTFVGHECWMLVGMFGNVVVHRWWWLLSISTFAVFHTDLKSAKPSTKTHLGFMKWQKKGVTGKSRFDFSEYEGWPCWCSKVQVLILNSCQYPIHMDDTPNISIQPTHTHATLAHNETTLMSSLW